MGMLSRFADIMRANVNALLDRSDDPEKTIDEYMRSLRSDLGKVKAETASVLANEARAKRALEEGEAESAKLQRYAEKAAQSGNEANARKFLERKAEQNAKLTELRRAYEQASQEAAGMKQMQDKLASDMDRLETRRLELQGKMAEASHRQRLNEGSSSQGDAGQAFQKLEEKANLALDEALALAELRAGAQDDDLDARIAELEKQLNSGTEAKRDASSPEEAADNDESGSNKKD